MEFVDRPVSQLSDCDWQSASSLFSEHYGIWSEHVINPSRRVRLSVARLKSQCGFSEDCRVSMAFDIDDTNNRQLVGHAFYTRKYEEESGGYLLWITQLVVHTKYRGKRISSTLCNMACGSRRLIACGLVSSNPLAVKSFQRALGLPIVVDESTVAHAKLLVAKLEIPYMRKVSYDVVAEQTEQMKQAQCVAHTNFFVDHTEVNGIRKHLSDWYLGELRDGDEYLAIIVPKEVSTRVLPGAVS
ncbi:hypothetical protein MP228_012099 [Amoeboaphelidium protococcarum]|nr:hypothetical protein MP228_012099 [Amoeboaphelidium protococcarum]